MSQHKAIAEDVEAVRRGQAVLEKTVWRVFPVGSRVRYEVTEGVVIVAVVMRHDYGARLLIKNVATGKDRHVDGASPDLWPVASSAEGRQRNERKQK